MTDAIRFFCALLLVGAGLALVVILSPRWLPAVGGEPATFDRAIGPVHLSEPSREAVVGASRIAAKAQVIGRLVARELDLFEAASHFRALNHEPPEFRQFEYRRLPGSTDEEKLCRQVILWVETHVGEHLPPREAARRVAELKATLASRLREGGAIVLPE